MVPDCLRARNLGVRQCNQCHHPHPVTPDSYLAFSFVALEAYEPVPPQRVEGCKGAGQEPADQGVFEIALEG